MYQSTSLEYCEPIEDYDMDNNYDPNIPKWVDANYPRNFMYDDAQVNVLEEALPIQINHRRKGIRKERRNPKLRINDYEDLTMLAQILSQICVLCKVRGHVIT